MSIDLFSIHCDALDGARLAGFKGVEALNRPFELNLFFTVPVGTEIKGAIGSRATLTADRDDGRGPMCWHGILASIRLLHETAERTLYRAVLVPKLWLLRRHVRSFVHTKKKIDAFTADMLQDGGLTASDFALHMDAGAYPQEEFVCQYRESHLDFVHRWFEREGVYYYFEHPEGAGASERMIVVDDKAHHHPLFGEGHVRYFPAAGHDTSAGECFRELSADFEMLPANVLISDYNYANPAAPVTGEKAISQVGQGTIREYGYRVFTEGEAKRLAQVKAQSMACRELVLTASGTYLGLRAGYTFEVEEAPSDLPAKYLAIEVRHAGAVSGATPMVRRYTGLDANETYRVDVVAIPSNVQYRAPQSTAWPRIYGFENATVDGPGESQYAQIDDQGRYLVRLKFDAGDLPDGSTSTYLRMMQPHGGTTEGWHFPLRKGTEVMVSFQGGDPDRPVIAGVVPNAVQPSNVTSKNHTQNVLRTGGGNEMIMEDIDGAQWIGVGTPAQKTALYMGTPRATTILFPPTTADGPSESGSADFSVWLESRGSAGFDIGGSWWQHVSGNYWVDIGYTATVHYGSTLVLRVDGSATEFYNDGRTTTTKAGRTDTVSSGGMKQTITGGLAQVVNDGGSQTVLGDWKHQVSGKNHDLYGTLQTSVSSSWTAACGGSASLSAVSGFTINGGPTITLNCGELKTNAPSSWVKTTGKSLDFFGTKNSVGIQKFDACAVAIGVVGTKIDFGYMSASISSIKGENVGVRKVAFGAAFKTVGSDIKNAATNIVNAALTKLG